MAKSKYHPAAPVFGSFGSPGVKDGTEMVGEGPAGVDGVMLATPSRHRHGERCRKFMGLCLQTRPMSLDFLHPQTPAATEMFMACQ